MLKKEDIEIITTCGGKCCEYTHNGRRYAVYFPKQDFLVRPRLYQEYVERALDAFNWLKRSFPDSAPNLNLRGLELVEFNDHSKGTDCTSGKELKASNDPSEAYLKQV